MSYSFKCDCGHIKQFNDDVLRRTIICSMCKRTYVRSFPSAYACKGYTCPYCKNIVDSVYAIPRSNHRMHIIYPPIAICSRCVKSVTKEVGELYIALQRIHIIDSI